MRSKQRTYSIPESTPSLIVQSGDLFYVVNGVEPGKDDRFNLIFERNKGLTLGIDIREIPTRRIELLVKVPKRMHPVRCIIEELRKFASVAACDYVSYETCGGCITELVARGDIGQIQRHAKIIPQTRK